MANLEDERTRAQQDYFPPAVEGAAQRFFFPGGAQEVRFRATVANDIPELLDQFGYRRAFIFSSRTLNRSTDVVDGISRSLGRNLVGRSDRIGEHAPLTNILAGIGDVREAGADVLVCIGGGSVMDFGKFVQLGVTEGVRSREEFLALRAALSPKLHRPDLRQITIPTTFSLSEWTPAGTPVDDLTGKKIALRVPEGVGRALVYDPDVVKHTPTRLALVTAIRGLDHSINNVITSQPNELVTVFALEAIGHFYAAIRALAHGDTESALPTLQRASLIGGLCQMSVPHGFSHFMVHVFAPWAHIGHSETACVMMLAQSRWLHGHPDPRLEQITAAMGRPGDALDEILAELLQDCGLPTSLAQLDVDPERLPEVIQLALDHPHVTRNNLRSITTAAEIASVLSTVAR